MAVNTNVPEVDATHPILEALASFRDEVNRLFDEQKTAMLQRAAELERDAPAEGLSAHPAPAEIVPARVDPEPKSRKGVASSESAASPTSPEPATPPPSHHDDPRQRLDALAKLLDKRRKPTGSADEKGHERAN